MRPLQLIQKVGRTRLTFQIQGNLNQACYSVVDEVLTRSQGGPNTVHLDLSGVVQLDLRGLTWLLSLERQLGMRGQTLQILRPTRQVKGVLRMVHPAVRPRARAVF
ncbi:STAS domain-containing protein [bacterium]|nr:STAS domain-containing protein [bacterium]